MIMMMIYADDDNEDTAGDSNDDDKELDFPLKSADIRRVASRISHFHL